MDNYSSLRKSNKSRLGAAGGLLLCVLLTGTMLFSRLAGFAPPDSRLYIPLTQSRGLTTVQSAPVRAGAYGTDSIRLSGAPAPEGVRLSANPGFQVTDRDTVWSGETPIEIFRITYENGEGQVTVNSSNGDKLLAPGTENTYAFALENTGNVPLRYTMEMEAWFSHEEYRIPVYARLTDHQGNYLVGTEENAADVLELNSVSREGTIGAGYIMPFSLHWEWPFELDDEYDTMLGNMAVDEDITLTIVIRTTAAYDGSIDPDDPGGIPPKTGDDSQLLLYGGLMAASLVGIVLLLIPGKKEREEQNG